MAPKKSRVPLTDEQAEHLLMPHEIVRDPIHDDIEITALERRIIDTTAFQRLRGLSQLGPTQMVYPGATHTRFAHSLGVLHCAEKLVRIVNSNMERYDKPTLMEVLPYPHLLVRLYALLHDVAHMPFGHTLEDEGNLADPEWEDDARVQKWLAPEGEIASALTRFLSSSGIGEVAALALLEDLRNYIVHNGDPMDLEYPFIKDLVGNTICADLLDYLERDMYYCGLRERSGDRVVKYLAVVRLTGQGSSSESEGNEYSPTEKPAKGKGRVVLLTYRFEREHIGEGQPREVPKFDILSEAIDLLRRRFDLAEKVFFHRTKLAASAMLISAVDTSSIEFQEIYGLSEFELLARLLESENERARRLAQAYMERRLYKVVYELRYREEKDADQQSKKLWREHYPEYREASWRRTTEEALECYRNLPAGSIVIYCPERSMNLKEFQMLVQARPQGEVKELRYILDDNRRLEMQAINQRYSHLWKLLVLVDPDEVDPSILQSERVENLNACCESLLHFHNDIEGLRGKGKSLREQLADLVVDEFQKDSQRQVPHDVYRNLVEAPHRGEGKVLLDALRRQLAAAMGPTQLNLEQSSRRR